VSIDNKCIEWGTEFRYLGVTIVAAKVFSCNLHTAKLKFYRSINGILGKIGSSPNIAVTLSLISSHCNPVLLYGMESVHLSTSQMNSLSHPYNSAYMKLFNSFDMKTVTTCQYYCGHLPLSYTIDLRKLKLYTKLKDWNSSPANILFNWFGGSELEDIMIRYNIGHSDSQYLYVKKMWTSFEYAVANI
jgi:hypothetical protein